MMELISRSIEQSALKFKMKHMFDPFNRRPREEPAKKYLYEKDGSIKDEDIPYKTEYPNKIPRKIRREMKLSNLKYKAINKFLSWRYKVKSNKKINELDAILLKNIRGQSYGGF
jgi:hypothetical protein